jgi:hypothetical protein
MLRNRLLLLAIASGAFLGATEIAALDFPSAFHDRSGTYLLSAVGDGVYAPQPGSPPKLMITFRDPSGGPFRWQKSPRGLARWQSAWLISDGTTRITRFKENGAFAGVLDLPAHASFITVCGPALCFVNPVARSPSERIFKTVDGKKFLPLPPPAGGGDEPFLNLSHNLLVIGGSTDGTLYFIPLFGQPILRRLLPAGTEKAIPIAYSRSQFRASLDEVIGEVGDATKYSLPARDLLVLEGGDVIVLRNHEDVRGASGRLEPIKGKRADWYDRSGKHIATATFNDSARWLVSFRKDAVSATTRQGVPLTSRWAKPIAGEVLR